MALWCEEKRCQVIQPYIDWLTEWNAANDSELDSVMDKLDGVIVGIVGDCELEGIDTAELKTLLQRHRNYKYRILEKRMDVAEELDLLLKRITGERLRQSQESDATEKEVDDLVPILLARFYAIWKRRKTHDHQWVADTMATKTTTDEWEQYRVAKRIKSTTTIVSHFKELSKKWTTEPSRIPSNLK